MARTLAHASAACSLNRASDLTISAEAHVESIAVLRAEHAALLRDLDDLLSLRRWAERQVATRHDRLARIERAIVEVVAGSHAAERVIIRYRRRSVRGAA